MTDLDDKQVRKRDVALVASWLVPGTGHRAGRYRGCSAAQRIERTIMA
jgi:hypothetical protein